MVDNNTDSRVSIHPDSLPVAGQDIASVPQEMRISVKKTGQFIKQQYLSGMHLRRNHAVSWIMVESFLRGIHYFQINGLGLYKPIPKKPGRIREIVPVIDPMYTHVLGLFNSNSVGVSAIPTSASANSIYRARRAEDILNGWIDEVSFASKFDEGNQILLQEGMFAYHPYMDPFREEVFVRVFPQSSLFPIPYDAKNWDELHGLIHASVASKQFLELQDQLFEVQTGRPPVRRMADKAKGISSGMSMNLPGLSIGGGDGKIDGALTLTVWMRKTEPVPSGEYMFMVGDEVFRHAVGEDAENILYKGEIPAYPVYFNKIARDFWGQGLCEKMIPQQLSQNRALTDLAITQHRNKGLLAVDSDSMNIADIQDEDTGIVSFLGNRFTSTSTLKAPFFQIPPVRAGRDTYGVIQMGNELADRAAGLRSGIAFGQAEGRVESGPATNVLAQNATAPLNSAMVRHLLALGKLYPHVLDLTKIVWPTEKTIRISGPNNVGREIKVQKEDIPPSAEVILKPRPILAGGRNQLLQMLFTLKQLPGPEGKPGTELTNKELRQSIHEMGLMPPGLDLFNKAEARIQTRINMLIGDGQEPATPPSNPENSQDRMRMENHRMAFDMLRDVILDDAFLSYGQQVQQALTMQLAFHNNFIFNTTTDPNDFDNDVEALESEQSEQFLSASEADLETAEGTFNV